MRSRRVVLACTAAVLMPLLPTAAGAAPPAETNENGGTVDLTCDGSTVTIWVNFVASDRSGESPALVVTGTDGRVFKVMSFSIDGEDSYYLRFPAPEPPFTRVECTHPSPGAPSHWRGPSSHRNTALAAGWAGLHHTSVNTYHRPCTGAPRRGCAAVAASRPNSPIVVTYRLSSPLGYHTLERTPVHGPGRLHRCVSSPKEKAAKVETRDWAGWSLSDGFLTVEVGDDGVGFDPPLIKAGGAPGLDGWLDHSVEGDR